MAISRMRQLPTPSVVGRHRDDGDLQLDRIVALLVLEEAHANEGVDFCWVQRDLDGPHPAAATPTVETHALGRGAGQFSVLALM